MVKVSSFHNKTNSLVGHIILGTGCNLACEYCYEQGRKIVTLSNEQIEKIINFYFEFAITNSRKHVTIQLFGGEPFIYIDKINYAMDYAYKLWKTEEKYKDLSVLFGVVTNCTIWNDDVKNVFLNMRKLFGRAWIQFSTDGTPEVNNIGRPAINNVFNTGEVIDKNLRLILTWLKENKFKEDVEFRLNSIVSKKNIKYMSQSFKYYCEEMGFRSGTRFRFVVEEDWTAEDAAEYDKQLNEIFNYCIETKKYHILKSMQQFARRIKNPKGLPPKSGMCGVGRQSFCVAPNMKIYPCQRRYFTCEDDYFGSIDEEGNVKINQQRYDYYYFVDFPTNITTNGVRCSDCLKNKNFGCRICIDSNRSKNGSETIGCSAACQMSSVENKWQNYTYEYMLQNSLI